MYPHFIEVHTDEGTECSVNVDHITVLADRRIRTDDGEDANVDVQESYEELKQLIRAVGCLIQKGDPRLDTAHPLKWDDLTKIDMIGEPVWNSNSLRWMLLIDSANDRTWIELINDAGGHEKWIEHDTVKFPLYRMRGRI